MVVGDKKLASLKIFCLIGFITIFLIYGSKKSSVVDRVDKLVETTLKTTTISAKHEIDLGKVSLQNLEEQYNDYKDIRNSHLLLERLLNRNQSTISSFLVIVVQVHNRIDYLKYVVESLRNVKYIEETLLIFSHDYYSPEIDKIVDSIDFCATFRIFYPFSERPNQHDILLKNNSIRQDWLAYPRNGESQIKHHFLWKVCLLKSLFCIDFMLSNILFLS